MRGTGKHRLFTYVELPTMIYDITDATFDELVDFYFDHPDIKYGSVGEWYYDAEVLYDSMKNANFFIALFREPRSLLEKFRRGQLDQGFWAITSYAFEGNLLDLLFEDDEVPTALKDDLIRSVYDLYEKLFAVDEIGQSSIFFWNHLTSYGRGHFSQREKFRHLNDVIFEMLLRLLDSAVLALREHALYGLEKLRHMETAPTLTRFLKTHRKLPKDIKAVIQDLIDNNPA